MGVERAPVPTRRWEYLYRLLDFAGAAIVEHDEVMRRRVEAGVTASPLLHNFAWEDREAAAPEACAVADRAAAAWTELFDRWHASRDESGCCTFVFPDVYAVGFFVAVLHCDDTVYFRGQQQAEWQLETSHSRAARRGDEYVQSKVALGQQFMQGLSKDPGVRRFYDDGDPLSDHLLAAAQHYSFPTHFLDFTTEFEVAAFFAEGGSDDVSPFQQEPRVLDGAIYAVPAGSLPLRSTRLITLPPGFQRPRLQRGVFLLADPASLDLASFEQAKFRFAHAPFPLRRGTGNLRWGKAPGLSEFYFPVRDSFAGLAKQAADFEEDPVKRWHDQWLRDTYDLCFYDRGEKRMWVNDHHLRLRCKSEPVLAVRTFEGLVRRLAALPGEAEQARNSGMMFFLRSMARAIVHEGVTPSKMRQRIEQLVAATPWLREAPSAPGSSQSGEP